ncbi:MAG: hypothetical protein C5B53_13225 [Candidatus Melainabacteria bacterium]|nr:MAG: hypothetical protein C5B53_13225 [Candidatus Melainabacteria bacterium]
MSGSDRPAAAGDGAIPSALNFPAVVQGGGFARFEAPMTMPASFPSTVFARGDMPMAAPAPADLGWKPAPADVHLAPPTGDIPKVDALKPADAPPTVTVAPFDAAKPTDVLVRADNSVVYREGFTGNEANIRVAYEEGASKDAIQKAAIDAGNMQASHLPEGVAAPVFKDETGGKVAFDSDFESKFNTAVKEHMPKPKPDGKDEDDIKPPPDNNGGDTRPNPNPRPNPDDNNIKPDGEDKIKPDKDDVDSIVNGKDKAAQARDFTTKFGDTLLKSGGLHPAYYGQFLSAFLSPKIRDLLKRIANGDADAEKELEAALKADDGKEMKAISDGLDGQIKKLTDAGDKDGAAALTGFKKQLLGEDGKTPNMAMFKEIATFQQKVEKGEAGASDVARLFSTGDGKPNTNVQRAVCDLAVLLAGTQRKQVNPELPTEPTARKKAVEDYQKAVKETLMDLQIKPTAFTDLFKR